MAVPANALDQNGYTDKVAAEIILLAEAIRHTDADTPIPSCPGWTANRLATHIGMIHRWVEQTVRENASDPLDFGQFGRGMLQGGSTNGDWREARAAPLGATRRQADPN